jgi:hypothetical protein
VKTIETYRAHIKEKLKLKSAPELMRFAVNWVSFQAPPSAGASAETNELKV